MAAVALLLLPALLASCCCCLTTTGVTVGLISGAVMDSVDNSMSTDGYENNNGYYEEDHFGPGYDNSGNTETVKLSIEFVTNSSNSSFNDYLTEGDSLPEPYRDGFTFGGWYSEPGFVNRVYTADSKYKTLYAYWLEETKASYFSYAENWDNTIEIFEYYGYDEYVRIPEYIDGKPVVKIAQYAFEYESTIRDIMIPDSVTTIDSNAFAYCQNLESVTIGNGVTSIGSDAFFCCSNLKNVYFGNSVISIGATAFYACTALTSITIPDSVTSIGEHAFGYCPALESVYVSDLAAWCNISFANYESNPLSSARYLYLNDERVTHLVIPEGVTSISNYAFYGCLLTGITIPDSVEYIDEYSFGDSNSFTTAILPAWAIGSFYYANLETVVITSGDYIKDYSFHGCSNLKNVTIPDTVTAIGEFAFGDCTSLESIVIPYGVTSIGNGAFYNCTSLESIVIPDSVTYVSSAFQHCTALKSITVPTSVEYCSDYAFYGCTSIEDATIPTWVIPFVPKENLVVVTIIGGDRIDDYAFYGCSNLISLQISNSVTSMGNFIFDSSAIIESITYRGTVEQWNAISKGSYWNYHISDCIIYCTDDIIY